MSSQQLQSAVYHHESLFHRWNRKGNCRHVQLALARTEKEEQKRSLVNTRCNEYVLNKVRELQV